MTPSSLPPTYLCPKCKLAFGEAEFITKTGRRARWCEGCRIKHREKFTKLRPKKEAVASPALPVEQVAREEGYEGHPLATLLALSHIAGAKRAVAIRDGRSWKGKKAWRAYYMAKGALAALIAKEDAEAWEKMAAEMGMPGKRDPNSEPVS